MPQRGCGDAERVGSWGGEERMASLDEALSEMVGAGGALAGDRLETRTEGGGTGAGSQRVAGW